MSNSLVINNPIHESLVFLNNLTATEPVVVNQGGTWCFAGSTLVVTDKGSKRIDQIQKGDIVKTFNESTKEVEWKTVNDRFKFKNQKRTIKVKLKNGKEIIATEDHEFYWRDSWVPLSRLWRIFQTRRHCRSCLLNNKEGLQLTHVHSMTQIKEDYVYDISINDNHNYFLDVGDHVLVHNSGKTFSIMQVMVFLTLGTVYKNEEGRQENIKSLVVGQDVPNLKKGAISDFNEVIDIIVDSFPDNCKHFFEYTYNSTDKIVKFHFNNSELQFSSFQNKQSAKAGKRHYVFMNEANGIAWTIAEQLMFRAKIRTFLDYNPDAPFWVHHKLIGKKGTKVIYSNLSHNEYVPEKVRTELIAKGKANASFHKVYILGKTGATEGIVFPNVKWIQEMPKQYKREAFGMDFGYTNDPTTMVRILLSEGKIYAELMLYQKGLTGSDIGEWLKKIKFNKNKYLFTDVAPATVEEIRRKGFRRTRAAKKGAGSIVTGIDTIKNYGTINIVDNVHWRAEQVGYKYQEDKATGEPTNDPEQNKGVDHIWDALRYGIQGIAKRNASRS